MAFSKRRALDENLKRVLATVETMHPNYVLIGFGRYSSGLGDVGCASDETLEAVMADHDEWCLGLEYRRETDDGVLRTRVWALAERACVDVELAQSGAQDAQRLARFAYSSYDSGRETVRGVREWVRSRALVHVQAEKSNRLTRGKTQAEEIDRLRRKYLG